MTGRTVRGKRGGTGRLQNNRGVFSCSIFLVIWEHTRRPWRSWRTSESFYHGSNNRTLDELETEESKEHRDTGSDNAFRQLRPCPKVATVVMVNGNDDSLETFLGRPRQSLPTPASDAPHRDCGCSTRKVAVARVWRLRCQVSSRGRCNTPFTELRIVGLQTNLVVLE